MLIMYSLHLSELYLKRKMLQPKTCVENQITYFVLNNIFFPKIVLFMRQCYKNTVDSEGHK